MISIINNINSTKIVYVNLGIEVFGLNDKLIDSVRTTKDEPRYMNANELEIDGVFISYDVYFVRLMEKYASTNRKELQIHESKFYYLYNKYIKHYSEFSECHYNYHDNLISKFTFKDKITKQNIIEDRQIYKVIGKYNDKIVYNTKYMYEALVHSMRHLLPFEIEQFNNYFKHIIEPCKDIQIVTNKVDGNFCNFIYNYEILYNVLYEQFPKNGYFTIFKFYI